MRHVVDTHGGYDVDRPTGGRPDVAPDDRPAPVVPTVQKGKPYPQERGLQLVETGVAAAVDPDVVWAKMAAMAEGARIASREFWK